MKINKSLVALATGSALLAFHVNAMACSTVIVGKDVSETGTIIVGHNEDNGGRILSIQHYVPPATHPAGEMIKFEAKAAPIPQVEKTLGFYWSETFDPSGASFSDGFVNDKGVTIVSNACPTIFQENVQELKDGGVGYGIRRIMAERANSAREAVKIATELLGKYGYFAEGRTYTIADPNEAWQLAIHQGNTWVARKVKDNEIVYLPNNFMMDKVDATDTENVIVAPGTIERAIQQGRYKPATPGVYKDFNFREAVQPAKQRAAEYNVGRNSVAWKKITGQDITDPEKFPYSVVPNRKFGVKDVKEILRLHEANIGEAFGWMHMTGFGPCRPTTHESAIFVMDENPQFIQMFRTLARPCETPYVPLFPLAKPAEGTSFMDWQTANAEHFNGQPEHFSYNPAWPVWTFVEHANTIEFQKNLHKENTEFVAKLEEQLSAGDQAAIADAKALAKVSPEKAEAFLHTYNLRKFRDAESAVARQTAAIAPHKVAVLADTIDSSSDQPVEIVLFSDESLDATKVDLTKTYAGVSRSSIGSKGDLAKLAQAVSTRSADLNGDGKADLVLSFLQKEVSANMIPGAVYDVWFYTFSDGKPVSSYAPALIK